MSGRRAVSTWLLLVLGTLLLAGPTVAQNGDGRIYWTSQVDVRRAALDGSEPETLLPVPFFAGEITLDLAAAKMYWFHLLEENDAAPFVLRANTDGSSVETLFSVFNGSALAVDSVNAKLYYGTLPFEQGCGRIYKSNLDGSNSELLIDDQRVHGLALDVPAGKLYWTDRCDNAIKRSNLDGSDIETLVATDEVPTKIALHSDDEKVYWTASIPDEGSSTGGIFRSDLDGSNVETVFVGPPNHSLAVDDVHDRMYWSEPHFDYERIRSSDLDGSNVEEIATESESYGLAVDPLGEANDVPSVGFPGIVGLVLLMLAGWVVVLRPRRVAADLKN